MPLSHPLNFHFGWALVLAAFVSGSVIGLKFHDESFLGGYGSFPRRLLRLGHVALAALGAFNVLFSLCPVPGPERWSAPWASRLWLAGAAAMPLVCFLSAWKRPLRHLFFIPVASLIAAVILTMV
jgi:hypothetical protein